jgi:two-component system NtrC family sensor kinase
VRALGEFRKQFVSALLVIMTVAAVSCAVINFQQQSKYHLPDDGVTWVERQMSGAGAVVALHVAALSPADRAGIRGGDVLRSIGPYSIAKAPQVAAALQETGVWNKAEYSLERNGKAFQANVYVAERQVDSAIYYQYVVGLAYLLIGLFVYFRRGNDPHSAHFYILCLTSFILSSFHYTGKLNPFDEVIYLGNVVAGMLAPAIFLHFCLAFPERPRWLRGTGRILLVYLPGLFLLTVYMLVVQGRLRMAAPLIEIRWALDRLWLLYLSGTYLLGAAWLTMQYRRAEDAVVRRQLKYLRNGAVLGVVPFTAVYVVPYLLGSIPGHYQNIAVLSLLLVPITWAYAILRYRLMDVDIIFQQGYVYTLATVCVLGVFYGLIFLISRPENLSAPAIIGLIVFATFIFQPIRDYLQEFLDRYVLYKERYDYRRTLISFARELTSETDVERMLETLGKRLVQTLPIQHAAFFLAEEDGQSFRLKTMFGERGEASHAALDLSFLSAQPDRPYIFFERTRHLLDAASRQMPATVRATIAELDLTYYFACQARGRMVAWMGVSRTNKNDFLSSDDVDLLVTLSGYIGIAVENAGLYRSLQHKAEEYERLKEFSENIVESINVGILAADLEDRVESWNTQIERLTGIPRERAVGRRLSDLLPADLCEKFNEVRGGTGIHNVYKFAFRPAAVNGNGSHAHPREAVLNVAIAPLVSKEMQQIGRLIIFDDITDRDELERRLVQADKLSSIGLLAAGVAHEVNTPLAVISTYAQMLARQISDDSSQSKLLDKIAKQTFRASEIVNSLLNFSRTSTTELVEVDLNRVIRETLALIEHQLNKAAVRTELLLNDRLPAIRGNSGKLQQVFLNLFLNARDAMEQGGMLSIRTTDGGGGIRVEVTDTGQGIPAENLPRIYDPFFTTKGARKGTGLGLSVTYGIVREHGGKIEVESQLGAGTRFVLDFPPARKSVHA